MDTQLTKKKIPKTALQFQEPANYSVNLAEDGGVKKITSFSMDAYSGKIIKEHWLWGDLAIDVSGLTFNSPKVPIFEDHYLDKKIGIALKVDLEDNKVYFPEIRLLSNEDAQKVGQNMSEEFPYQASISVKPLIIEELSEGESADVNGYKMKGPGTIFRKALFREASVCAFGYDHRTKVTPLSECDNEEMEYEVLGLSEGVKLQKSTGGKSMTFDELKVQDPKLAKEIEESLSEKDKKIVELTEEIKDLKKSNTDLTEENKENEKRIVRLESSMISLKETSAKDRAESIINAAFAKEDIPAKFRLRIKKYLNFKEHLAEDGSLDEAKFSEHVNAEVTSWKTDLGELSPVLGIGGGGAPVGEFTEQQADELADKMVELAYGKKSSKE